MGHATGNVLNDLHDARNGADAANTQGITPFTGGSRLIQTGQATERQTAELAKALLVFLVPGGLWLAVQVGSGQMLLLGAAGLALARAIPRHRFTGFAWARRAHSGTGLISGGDRC